MKRFVVLLIILLFVCASVFAQTDKNKFRGFNLQLSTKGYHDSDHSLNDNWHLSEANTIAFGIKGGRFSRNNKHAVGGGFRFKYKDSKEVIKLTSSTLEDINDFFNTDIEVDDFSVPFVNPYMKIQFNVFYRYSVLPVDYVPNLRIWLEVESSMFRKWTLDDDKHLSKPYTTGLEVLVHPVLSYEINETLSIETSVDVFYLYGKLYYQEQSSGNDKTSYVATISSTNINTVLEAALNIGIIRRF